MGWLRVLGLAVALLTSVGCGTVMNLNGGLPDGGAEYPYGGALIDGVGMVSSANILYELGTGQAVNESGLLLPLGVLAIVDLPFSIAADTLTLPWTLWDFVHLDKLGLHQREAPDEKSSKPD